MAIRYTHAVYAARCDTAVDMPVMRACYPHASCYARYHAGLLYATFAMLLCVAAYARWR